MPLTMTTIIMITIILNFEFSLVLGNMVLVTRVFAIILSMIPHNPSIEWHDSKQPIDKVVLEIIIITKNIADFHNIRENEPNDVVTIVAYQPKWSILSYLSRYRETAFKSPLLHFSKPPRISP